MHPIIKTKSAALKRHVRLYRGRYSALATLTVCVAVNSVRVSEMNTLLKDHDLFEKFYAPEGFADNS